MTSCCTRGAPGAPANERGVEPRSSGLWTCFRDSPKPVARDDRFPGCRSLQVEQHVIYFCQPDPDEIEVIRILHQRQDAGVVVKDAAADES
jgi:hypothetical protein